MLIRQGWKVQSLVSENFESQEWSSLVNKQMQLW